MGGACYGIENNLENNTLQGGKNDPEKIKEVGDPCLIARRADSVSQLRTKHEWLNYRNRQR